MAMNKISLLTVTYKTPVYSQIVLSSFEKYKPDNLDVEYVVVENSDSKKGLDVLEDRVGNLKYINNPTSEIGSMANGVGIELGKNHIREDSEWVFVCHSDVCVISEKFFNEFNWRAASGDVLIGASWNGAKKHIHCSGYFIRRDLLMKVNLMPVWSPDGSMQLDVGDTANVYCEENNLASYCMDNTHNIPGLKESMGAPYSEWDGVDICVSREGEQVFLHLGRGTWKSQGKYSNPNKVNPSRWIDICRGYIE